LKVNEQESLLSPIEFNNGRENSTDPLWLRVTMKKRIMRFVSLVVIASLCWFAIGLCFRRHGFEISPDNRGFHLAIVGNASSSLMHGIRLTVMNVYQTGNTIRVKMGLERLGDVERDHSMIFEHPAYPASVEFLGTDGRTVLRTTSEVWIEKPFREGVTQIHCFSLSSPVTKECQYLSVTFAGITTNPVAIRQSE
jgi:hypothetical protein